MTTELKKKMEKLAEDFMEQWLSAPGSIDYLAGIRDYKAGFTAAVDEMEKINQGAREFWVLEDELKFGNLASSDPRDHAAQTVLFRIPICTDRLELAIRLREVKND